MIEKKQERNEFDLNVLGKSYDIFYTGIDSFKITDDKIYVKDRNALNKKMEEMATKLFNERLNKIYASFPYEISLPALSIRKMKTRWGVCNYKKHKITLNKTLINLDVKFLDYVIVHELSHLLVPNHSKAFWQVVEKIVPNYKEIRKELKRYG